MSDDAGEELPQMKTEGPKPSTLRGKASALAHFHGFLATTRGCVY